MTENTTTDLCPTCGSRTNPGDTKCLVCGTNLTSGKKGKRGEGSSVQASRMPEVTLSLPIAFGLLALFLIIGGGLVFFVFKQAPGLAEEALDQSTETSTPTESPTVTPTETAAPPTETPTPLPTPTPRDYVVQAGDLCGSIAFTFEIDIQSLILENDLDANCTIFEGKELKIPHPTPTQTPLPSATLDPTQQYVATCSTLVYEVQANDTLSTIAANYALTLESIKRWNGLVSDQVNAGQNLVIPLCERDGGGNQSTPTPTPPPPYPAVNLLKPADGAPYTLANNSVPLQWASVGQLRDNEFYKITIIDITDNNDEKKLVQYVVDTKFIVPVELRPASGTPHVFRWYVETVRQVGTDNDGKPVYQSAGAVSQPRVFSWSGAAATE